MWHSLPIEIRHPQLGACTSSRIVHEIVHAVAGAGHKRRFVARLRSAADSARDHGLADLAAALRTEAAAYENTPPVRAREV